MVAMNILSWSHQSFTGPFTATGRSALVPRPPWHYAGWLLNIGFRFDAQSAASLVLPAQATIGAVGWPDLRQPQLLPELTLVKPGQRRVAVSGLCPGHSRVQ
jgi:hypothetical protein